MVLELERDLAAATTASVISIVASWANINSMSRKITRCRYHYRLSRHGSVASELQQRHDIRALDVGQCRHQSFLCDFDGAISGKE
jgi:hypothetical protein